MHFLLAMTMVPMAVPLPLQRSTAINTVARLLTLASLAFGERWGTRHPSPQGIAKMTDSSRKGAQVLRYERGELRRLLSCRSQSGAMGRRALSVAIRSCHRMPKLCDRILRHHSNNTKMRSRRSREVPERPNHWKSTEKWSYPSLNQTSDDSL